MGSGGSVLPSVSNPKVSIDELVTLMMPVYYTHNAEITSEMLAVARECWKNIIEQDRSVAFLEMKKNPTFEFSNCAIWFYTVFYDRLFDVHPLCKPLFKNGLVSQGRFLVRMVTTTVNALAYPEKFKQALEDLAVRHCERGVKATEYSIVGDVLFFSLQKCLGPAYTHEVEDTWKKIYSAMIQIIVPLCLKYERSGKLQAEEGSERPVVLLDDPFQNPIEGTCSFDSNAKSCSSARESQTETASEIEVI
jgi:hemoglobin-like flavoprotein